VHAVPVKIGPYGEDAVPVLEGLAPGDWVVAAGAHLLQEGQSVRPVDRHDRVVAVAPARAPAPARP
jgi:multidrug efflux system membrane fusion protein